MKRFAAGLLLVLLANVLPAQNIRIDVNYYANYSSECGDCNGGANNYIRSRVRLGGSNGTEFQSNNVGCGWSGSGCTGGSLDGSNAGDWDSVSYYSTVNMQTWGYEDDDFTCGGDDGNCGAGDASGRYMPDYNPGTWYCWEGTRSCSSDGTTITWGGRYGFRWTWKDLNPGGISGGATLCSGDNPGAISSTSNGTQGLGGNHGTSWQWQSSPNGISWSDISGATGLTYDPPALTSTTYYRRAIVGNIEWAANQQRYTGSVVYNVTPLPAGNFYTSPIAVGALSCGSSYTNTQNNSTGNCFRNNIGEASDDIWYQFTLSATTTVDISTCASGFDTYCHFADFSGTIIASNDDNGPLCSGSQASLRQTLSAGTYYAVVEGWSSGSGNITTTISVPCPDSDWSLSCESQTAVEIFGRGINGEDTAFLAVPDPGGIDSLIVEVVAKGSSLPASCLFLTDSGAFSGLPQSIASASVPAVVFRATLPAVPSLRVVSANPATTYSVVIYAFRPSMTQAVAGSAVFAQVNLFQSSVEVRLPLSADTLPRRVVVTVPVTELDDDSRIGIIRAQAGPVSRTDTVQAPTLGNSLNIAQLVLDGVPGDVEEVVVEVESPPAPFGDSFLFSTVAATSTCAPQTPDCSAFSFHLSPDTLRSCDSEQLLLSAGTGFATYQWSTGDTSATTLAGSGWVFLQVSDSMGCTALDSVLVDARRFRISPSDTLLCSGSSVTLSVPESSGVIWSNGASTGSVTVSPTTDSLYIALFDNGISTCSDTASVRVGPPAGPPIFASCPDAIAQSASLPVTWPEPQVQESCNPPVLVEQIQGPPNGSLFPPGTTTVSYQASDALGQTALCTFAVTVEPDCPVPGGLQAVPTASNALLSWNDNPFYQGVQVSGRRVGDVFFGRRTTTANSLLVAGLLPATDYEWRVRARCLDGSFSNNSALQTFSTLSLRDPAPGPEAHLHPNPAGSWAVLQWSGLGQSAQLEIRDALGRLVHSESLEPQGQRKLDFPGWPSGLYLLGLQGSQGALQQRLVLETTP